MAITYPRDLPAGNIWRETCRFTPLYLQTAAPTLGGASQVANIGRDRWQMQYETVYLLERDALVVEAWAHSLKGGQRQFNAWHPMRDYLLSYPAGYAGLTRYGGGAFDGTCVLSSVAGTYDAITLSSLPAGLSFAVGDMVSILSYASGHRGLHRVLEAADASGSGVATLAVEPTVLPGFTTGGAGSATVLRPSCRAVINAPSIRMTWINGRRGSLAFSAVQTF